jgi:hypothetical protein
MTPQENSVKQLTEFYNVVTGAALAFAISKLIDSNAAFFPVKTDFAFNFLSFLITILPFHHGAVRHLFASYVEEGAKERIIGGALAIDFAILFLQACLFVTLALLIEKTNLFLLVLIALLFVDCVWGFLTHLTLSNAKDQGSEKTWALINLVASAILVVFYLLAPPLLGGWQNMDVLILTGCILRTALDYYFCWDFYYPPTKKRQSQRRQASR